MISGWDGFLFGNRCAARLASTEIGPANLRDADAQLRNIQPDPMRTTALAHLRTFSELCGTAESRHTSAMLALCITGFDVDPTFVTKTIGFEPTSIGRIGEPSPSGRPRTFNGWWHDAEGQLLAGGGQHDDALSRILNNLKGREDRFAELRKSIRPKQVTIYGGLYVPSDEQCGVWLEPDQMQLLAACGVGWGLDLFRTD